jgi:hypothetical protein
MTDLVSRTRMVELQKSRMGSRTDGLARMKSHMGGLLVSRRVSVS